MKTVDEYYEKGMMLCELGDCKKALPVLDEALKHYPDSTKLLEGKGSVLSALGMYEEALGSYEKAIEHDPEDPIGHINKGSVLCELGRFEEALVSFHITAELIARNKSVCLVRRDNQEHAEDENSLMKEVEVDPIIADTYNFMGIALHELGRFDEALEAFDTALELEPELSDTYYNFADVYFNKGNTLAALDKKEKASVAYVEALKLYTKAVEEYPEDALAYLDMGDALDGLGRHDEAKAAYKKASSLEPGLEIPELD